MLTWITNNSILIIIIGFVLLFVGRAFLHASVGTSDTDQRDEQPKQKPERVANTPPAPVVTQQRQQVSQQRPVSYHRLQQRRLGLGAYLAYRLETFITNRPVMVRQRSSGYTGSTEQQRPPVGTVRVIPVEEEEEFTTWDERDSVDDYELEDSDVQDNEEEECDVVEEVYSPVVVSSPAREPQPTSPVNHINTSQLLAGQSYKLDEWMDREPRIYLQLVFGLILVLYQYYRANGKIVRDPMIKKNADSSPGVYTRNHWDHLIGGEDLREACVLRRAGIVVKKGSTTIVGYPDAESACSRFYQWFIVEKRGTQTVAKEEDTDTEEREED